MRSFILILLISFSTPCLQAYETSQAWMVYPKAEEAFQIEVELPPGQTSLSLNKISDLIVTVKTPFSVKGVTISKLDFDARMPEHNHGMMTKPTVVSMGKNRFKVSGVKLHMEGFWDFIFSLTTDGGQRHKVVAPFTIANVGK